jgi:hypothetical protein
MNKLKAFVRFDGVGHIIAGSNILRQSKPTIGKWKEIAAYNKCCNSPVPPPPVEGGLIITFNSIPNADLLIGGSTSDVNVWNLFFELSNDNQYGSSGGVGTPFTSVIVDGNIVHLYGGANIALLAHLFSNDYQYGCLVSIDDTIECIVQIRDGAFTTEGGSCPNLVSVSFPGVNWIQPCFDRCVNLTTVNIPKVTYLGDWCFNNCKGLTSINVPLLTTTGMGCFQGCTSLTSINLPSLITAGVQCFNSCTELTFPNFPLLTTAGNYCFSYCHGLSSINFPLLQTIGSQCFSDCTNLISVDFPLLNVITAHSFRRCYSLISISIPNCQYLGTGGSGGTSGALVLCPEYNYVFAEITGNTITLTIPSYFMSNWDVPIPESPDGDVQYLQANNNVTIIYSDPIK